MNQERRDKIIKEHPLLFSFCTYFECQDGWLDIIEDLANKLETLIVKFKKDEYPEYEEEWPMAAQIKEKFGTLRFYMTSSTTNMKRVIEEAELKSSETCELCGKTGHRRNTAWITTLCDECF